MHFRGVAATRAYNKRMYRVSVLLIASCVPALVAQTPTDIFEKAPPHVDQALRARVAKYYQAFVDKKFRVADEVVAEDSKDQFFSMEKRPYLGFQIARINYSDKFTKATVVTAIELEWRTPRMGVQRVTSPMTSLWKLENGDWYWYVVPQKNWDSPWGKMHPGPDNRGPKSVLDAMKGVQPEAVMNAVSVNKPTVELSSYQEASDSVEVTNRMPGEVKLVLDQPSLRGLDVKLERDTLKPGESARITFKYAPETPQPKPTLTLNLRVEPTGRNIPIRVIFAVPPEAQRVQ